jgi:hypothetical protein
METYLLPFKLNDFALISDEIQHVLQKFTTMQRHAIRNFRLLQNVIAMGTNHYARRAGFSPLAHQGIADHNWVGLHHLVDMRGLKRVVVENWDVAPIPVQNELLKEKTVTRIIQCAKGREIEVVFEDYVFEGSI